ncbi:MAG: NAD(P)H-hydrate dehydratase [Phycisphaerales bacterium]
MRDESPLPRLPARDPAGHKGTFGTVVVVGGRAGPDVRMIGAPALVATGALRAGAGLARIAAPEPVLSAAIVLCPGATGVPIAVDERGEMLAHEASRVIDEQVGSCRCLVVGPGLGRGEGPSAAALRAVQQEEAPVVVDADALSALAEVPALHRDFRAAAVVTPHPGEYRRLAGSLNIRRDAVDAGERPAAAEELAQRLGCIVVLKGAGTVVSDGQRTWVCRAGGPMLATGGTGDVLAGVIAGVVAQFVEAGVVPEGRRPAPPRPLDLYDAARAAVEAHAWAGERWAETHSASGGLLAQELAECVPWAIERLRGPE